MIIIARNEWTHLDSEAYLKKLNGGKYISCVRMK